jgi:hypothetical protein
VSWVVKKFDAGALPHPASSGSADRFAEMDLVITAVPCTCIASCSCLHQAVLSEGNRLILHGIAVYLNLSGRCVWQMQAAPPSALKERMARALSAINLHNVTLSALTCCPLPCSSFLPSFTDKHLARPYLSLVLSTTIPTANKPRHIIPDSAIH